MAREAVSLSRVYASPFGRSLRSTVRHPPNVEGATHASSVIPVVKSSAAVSLMVTQSLTPSNDSALPYLPCVDHVAPEIVPVCPRPLRSTSVVPVPSLKL